jgi:hypothetical protein
MQVKLRCKRVNKSSGHLNVDATVHVKLALKPSHYLTDFFNQPLMPALICIYS